MTGNVFLKYVGCFVCGAAASTGSCVAALKLYQSETKNPMEIEKVSELLIRCPRSSATPVQQDIGRYGFPETGAEVRYYANHTLSYDQARKTPRWVAEHLSIQKLQGKADRKHCKFRPDPSIPESFTAHNEDYLGSGWSRGHLAPAGDNKSSVQSMAETFYLSNIVPQNYENNAGFWNRLEMYCRDLTKRFQEVWIVSGPLALPEEQDDGKRMVTYQVIGRDYVAVPTHLFKVILVGNMRSANQSASRPVALSAFVVPNHPIGFEQPLKDFEVSLSELEKVSGLNFFPGLGTGPLPSLCEKDLCQLMSYKEFHLYLAGRKVGSARSTAKLEQHMAELQGKRITPDDYLLRLYQMKKIELAKQEQEVQEQPETWKGI